MSITNHHVFWSSLFSTTVYVFKIFSLIAKLKLPWIRFDKLIHLEEMSQTTSDRAFYCMVLLCSPRILGINCKSIVHLFWDHVAFQVLRKLYSKAAVHVSYSWSCFWMLQQANKITQLLVSFSLQFLVFLSANELA